MRGKETETGQAGESGGERRQERRKRAERGQPREEGKKRKNERDVAAKRAREIGRRVVHSCIDMPWLT